MTTPLDRDLAERLERLAAAVPVRTGQLDPVHSSAVAARQRLRMAWLTPLVALLVLILLALLAGVIGFGGPRVLRYHEPVSATSKIGEFELTITSTQARYEAGEAIDIGASLTYLGQGGAVSVGDALGSGGEARLVHFGVVEPVPAPGGTVDLSGYLSRLMCDVTVMQPGDVRVVPFAKAAGTSLPIPPAWFREPLRLPVGTWHPYAVARIGLGGCDGSVELRAELAIDVVAAGPSAPASEPWRSSKRMGDFEVQLAAARQRFGSDEPLDVVASLTYRGRDDRVVISHETWGPLEFAMQASGITLTRRGRWSCSEIELERDVPLSERMVDPDGGKPFTVRHGLHEITASATFAVGGCGAALGTIETSILVAVSDGPDDIPLLTDESTPPRACLLSVNGGLLAVSATGLGVESGGEVREVIWPAGYGARMTPAGAVLISPAGELIATEGERIVFDARTPDDGPLRPCGSVRRDEPLPTPVALPIATRDRPITGDGRSACLLALATGWVIRHARTGVGIATDPDGDAYADIVWPTGYTGWLEGGIAVIRDADGLDVVREGDYVTVSGGFFTETEFVTCGGIQFPARPT